MFPRPLNILLADDDMDDCDFFRNTLSGYELSLQLDVVNDGEELMEYLFKNIHQLPDILFLDLSMPRKNGFECMDEISENENLGNLKVVIFTTAFSQNESYENELIKTLNEMGANGFITKRGDILQRRTSIHQAIIKAMV